MNPKTRKEHYLAKIAGEDVTVPEPKTRQEHYLKEIAENGGGGGGGGIFAVTTTFSMVDNEPVFSDANHSASEIFAAVEAGQLPVLFVGAADVPASVLIYSEADGSGDDVWAVFGSGGNGLRVFNDYTVGTNG